MERRLQRLTSSWRLGPVPTHGPERAALESGLNASVPAEMPDLDPACEQPRCFTSVDVHQAPGRSRAWRTHRRRPCVRSTTPLRSRPSSPSLEGVHAPANIARAGRLLPIGSHGAEANHSRPDSALLPAAITLVREHHHLARARSINGSWQDVRPTGGQGAAIPPQAQALRTMSQAPAPNTSFARRSFNGAKESANACCGSSITLSAPFTWRHVAKSESIEAVAAR
jgi:hypothetical protein